jgi:hypothetical protein
MSGSGVVWLTLGRIIDVLLRTEGHLTGPWTMPNLDAFLLRAMFG